MGWSDWLDYLIVCEFLLAVFWDKELAPMRVFESLDIWQILLVNSQESKRCKKHVFFSEGIELAHELADGSIAILYFRHLNEDYSITTTSKG